MKFSNYSRKIGHRIILGFLIVHPLNVLAGDNWSYNQERDRDSISNPTYSFAKSPLPPRGLYDHIRMEIICKNNTLQAVVDADSFITSQGRTFKFEYQIDKKAPVSVQMKTFNDSKRRGYSEAYAKQIADEILTGQSIFIRVNTMLGGVLSGKISLENAAESIKRVYSDCGLVQSDGHADEQLAYTLADFEQDFNKLTSEQQQHVLNSIKKIIMEVQQ